jgi:transcriptional regulator with XRE-family HTH domain
MTTQKTNTLELKKILLDQGLDKIIDLSKETGVNRNTLGLILRGEKQPSADVMDKLVQRLHIPPETAGSIFFTDDLRDG